MNKKVDEEFKNINDVYVLQCICTEMKDRIDTAINYIDNYRTYTEVKKATGKWEDGRVVYVLYEEDVLYEKDINELLEILGVEINNE